MKKVFMLTAMVWCAFGTPVLGREGAGALLPDSWYLGRVDTIGGTTYDWQVFGPIKRVLGNSPGYGLYPLWMYSSESLPFSDRNMRYNFYDYTTRDWLWIDPDFMNSGMNVYTERSGFGNLGVEGASGKAVFVAHQRPSGQPNRPVLAHESLGFCPGPNSFLYPVIAVGSNGWIHIAMTDQTTMERVFYSRCTTWCNWSEPRLIGEPGYPNYNIVASSVSEKVVIVWVKSIVGSGSMDSLFYRSSTDGGTTWSEPTLLLAPAAFGGDTITSFSEYGPFPYYDKNDRLHIVVPVMPVVNGTRQVTPAAIWHWCETNTPQWSLVRRAGCAPENMAGSLGSYANYVSHPSIGEGSGGALYVTWEEFDSLNVEPLTGLLRAGVWLASSTDNGQTWLSPLRLTPLSFVSHRFPCIIDQMVSGGSETDTVVVLYMMDSIAGFYVLGQGPVSQNPVVCQFVAQLVGVEERGMLNALRLTPNATIMRGVLRWETEHGGWNTVFGLRSSVFLLDVSGRKVLDLVPGANDIRHLPPGVYFIRLASGVKRDASGIQKVVITK